MIRSAFGLTVAVGLLGFVLASAAVVAAAEQIRLPRVTPLVGSRDAGSFAAWGDLEFRSSYFEDSDETEVFLALLPVDPVAREPRLTMTFRARYRGRSPVVPPGSVEIRINANPLIDPNLMRSPVMSLVVDQDSEDSVRLDLFGTVPDTGVVVPAGRVDTVFFNLPVGLQFLHLLNAETIDGLVFGVVDFAFTPAHINALRDFANQTLSPRR